MAVKEFYLIGDDASHREINIGVPLDMDELRSGVAADYAIMRPQGIGFEGGPDDNLDSVDAILDSDCPIGITVDGQIVREPAGPPGLPLVGSFYELYPDHIGNHQRLFNKYGSVIRTTNMGRVSYLSNDPEVAHITFAETEFFTKQTSNPKATLYGLRDNTALFACDTDCHAFVVSHKFIPPCMSPKAVRHYTPLLQRAIRSSFKVYDELDERGEAFNVYKYAMKMSGQTICQLVLGKDVHHFDSVDAPVCEFIALFADYLSLNRKVQTRGAWYAYLPFGSPKQLLDTRARLYELIGDAIKECKSGGTEDLPIHEAALKASCLVDYLSRATDERGDKLPTEYIFSNSLALIGAGFSTTSSLLSWLIYGLVTYTGNQERLIQELVDSGGTTETEWTYEVVQSMPFLDKFVKETLRMHSPSFHIGRNVKKEVILPGGYRLPADSLIIPTMPHMHRNPLYWSNPDRFEPDRWDTVEVKNRHKTLFIPFATGPRGCIGYNVALQQVKLAMANLVMRYRFEGASEEPLEYDPHFLLVRPMNLYARALKRMEWPKPTPNPEVAAQAT